MSIKHKGETVLQNLVNVPITSTINASSTNEECAGAKAVYDKVSEIVIPLYENGSQCVIEDVLATYDEDSNFDILFSGNTSGELFDLTGNKLFLIEHRSYLTNFKTERAINAATGSIIAQRSKAWWGAGWSKWEKVCTTTVADISLTSVEIPSDLFETINNVSYIKYEVVNGIAFVYMFIRDAKFSSAGISRNIILPKAKNKYGFTAIGESMNSIITVIGDGNTAQLWCLGNDAVITNYSMMISYPVKES